MSLSGSITCFAIAVHSQTILDTRTCQNDPAWIAHSCVLMETTLDTCMHMSCTYQNDPAWISDSCILTEPHWIHAHAKMILIETPIETGFLLSVFVFCFCDCKSCVIHETRVVTSFLYLGKWLSTAVFLTNIRKCCSFIGIWKTLKCNMQLWT